jgi:hypothetical protein
MMRPYLGTEPKVKILWSRRTHSGAYLAVIEGIADALQCPANSSNRAQDPGHNSLPSEHLDSLDQTRGASTIGG